MLKKDYRARISLFAFTLLLVVVILPFYARTQLTAVETVELFFDSWSNHDEKTMKSLLSKGYLEKRQGRVSFSDHLIYVDLISCREVFYPEAALIYRIEDMWEEKHVSASCVRAHFEIAYEENHGSGFDNTSYLFDFYLVKKTPIGPWMIAAYGQ